MEFNHTFSATGNFHLLLRVILLILLFTSGLSKKAYPQNEDMEEIPVTVRVQGVGAATFNPIYIYDSGMLLLPVADLFHFLQLKAEPSATLDSLSGFIVSEEKRYLIDNQHKIIIFDGQKFAVGANRLIKTETALYLDHLLFGEIFGLDCRFNFRGLSVEIKPGFELPVIREMRLKQFRKNIEQLRGEVEADTTLHREYHIARFGMADWAVTSTQSTRNINDTRLWLATGAELLGGETNLLFQYSTREGLNHRNQQYYWRWANNLPKAIRQVRIGRIMASGISSIYDPVVGISATNARTTYRRSFGEYTINDFTEPGWTVELYVNNVIVDYQTADATGFYSFNVPLVYGTSQVMLKFYGPYGEERIREQFLNIPFNFLPPGELEYTVSSGIVLDGSHSRFGRAEAMYGLNRFLTLGGGYEYLSSITTGTGIPFLTASVTPIRNLMLTGEYAKDVRTKGLASYRLPSGPSLEVEYAYYTPGQEAVRLSYLEERKATLSLPVRAPGFNGYSRMSYRQNVYEMLTYNSADITLSTFRGKFNANMSAYANWLTGRDPFIYGNLGLGVRMRQGFTFRPQGQFDITNSAVTSVRAELEKRISRQGYISVMGEENFRSDYRSINFSFRWDFSFSQVNLSTRISNYEISSTQGAQGSFAFGSGKGYVHADNRSSTGRSGVSVLPFIDINHNGVRDDGEPVAEGVSVRMNGGRIIKEAKDSIIRITGLEPYTSYLLTLDDKGLSQISYRIEHKNIRVYVDPNQFRKIDIPVKPMGEVNGWVYLKNEKGTRGQGRILVNIYTQSGSLVTSQMTERDGGFTWLGLAPGDYYARVDSAQVARLNWSAYPERIDFHIKPDFYGDIIYDLEFTLSDSKDRAETSVPVSQDSLLTLVKEQDTHSIGNQSTPDLELHKQNDTGGLPGQETGTVYYSVQLGAFAVQQNALELLKSLEERFDNAGFIIFEDGMYKVRTGHYADYSEAENQKEFFIIKGWNCFVASGN